MTPTIEKMFSEKYKSLFKAKLSQLQVVERKLEVLEKKCLMMKVKNKELRNENLFLKRYEKNMEWQYVKEHHKLARKAKTLNVLLKYANYFIVQIENHNKQLKEENEQLTSQNQHSATSEEVESLRIENRSLQYNNIEHHANIEQLEVEKEMY